jgi:hypothetical protein
MDADTEERNRDRSKQAEADAGERIPSQVHSAKAHGQSPDECCRLKHIEHGLTLHHVKSQFAYHHLESKDPRTSRSACLPAPISHQARFVGKITKEILTALLLENARSTAQREHRMMYKERSLLVVQGGLAPKPADLVDNGQHEFLAAWLRCGAQSDKAIRVARGLIGTRCPGILG